MDSLFDLSGRVAIVTGGAGGIGRAQALGLAEAGADVVVTSRQIGPLEEIAEEIEATGRKALAITVDVTQEESVSSMVKQVLKEFPRIDILVNAAGITINRPASEFPLNDWQKVMDVNVRGTWLCCQAVGCQMIKQLGGHIINISSVAGSYGVPGGGAGYGPSKGAVDTLTRVLACEWAKYNVLVNALAPTVVETELMSAVLKNPDVAQSLKGRIPLGRWANPHDIVGPTLFFAAQASNFVTGQILFVDGGLTTRVY